MKKQKTAIHRRLLALLLVMVMAIGLLPTVALAEDDSTAESEGTTPTVVTEDPLNTTKTVVSNGNGTYKITLSVTGAAEESTHTVVSSANVIIVLDKSTSMDENFGSGTRLEAVTDAAEILIDAMPNAANVEMALISFGGEVSTDASWTTINNDNAKTTLKNKLPTSTNRGTNWTDALSTAKELADDKKSSGDTDPTYIIFLTDGCPTTNKSEQHNHGSSGTTNVNDTCISDPLATMTNMVTSGYNVYGIYANTTTDSTRPYSGNSYTGHTDPLAYVIDKSGAGELTGDNAHYFKADNTDTLKKVFTDLAQTITSNLNYSDVEIDDGVTAMSNTSASTAVSGEATGFTYKKGGNTWTDAPEAKVVNGSVIWDLSSIGDLEDGVTYTVSFDIWPSQESYDLLADINNAIVRDADGNITKYSSADDAYNALSADVKSQIFKDVDGVYKLRTNTHLTTYYTYNGTSYSYTPDSLTNGSMALAAEKISLEKLWPKNMLDKYGAASYRDEDGNELTADEIKLTLTKDGKNYLEVTVGKDNEWKADDIYISCGVMTVNDNGVSIKETGYDYTVTEPASFSYYWDLIAPVYHPMVINGTATLLVLDETKTAEDVTNGVYKIGEKYYVTVSDNSATLEASNYRRSNLNLTKAVDGEAAPKEDYFTYTATVKDENSTDGYVWFSAWDPKAGATVKATNWVISGANPEAGDTGYWYAKNGEPITFKIKAGWNVRFLNLYHGSTFSFEETAMPDNYQFNEIEAEAQYDFVDTTIGNTWYKVDSENTDLITGTIVEPNNSYTVTYTNDYRLGNLQIIKSASGADVPGNATFTVTGPNNYSKTVKYSDFKEKSYLIEGLSPGEYKVVEGDAEVDSYSLDTKYSPESGKATVTKGQTATVTVSNTYTRDTGTLTIKKELGKDSEQVTIPPDTTFTISGPQDYTGPVSVTYKEFNSGVYTATVPTGDYTITESNAEVAGYTLSTAYSSEGGKVSVTKGETAEVTVTNTYTEKETPPSPPTTPTGKVIIVKETIGDTTTGKSTKFRFTPKKRNR